jgi:hypothetical protein
VTYKISMPATRKFPEDPNDVRSFLSGPIPFESSSPPEVQYAIEYTDALQTKMRTMIAQPFFA